MRQGLDVVDVEQRTKIRAKYLRALENEEWALLPGPTFVRTFLRTYAEAVGLDPHALVEAYRTQYDDSEEPDAPQQPRATTPRRRTPRSSRSPERRRAAGPSGPPGPLAVLGGLIVLVLIGLLVLGLVGGDDDSNPDDQKARQTTTTPPTNTAPRRPAPRRPAPKPRPAGVTVKVEPAAPTYVCMDAGPGTPTMFEGTLDKARTFKNPKEIRINLGKRDVEVTANGKPVTISPSGDPLGLRITRTGSSEIADGPRPCA